MNTKEYVDKHVYGLIVLQGVATLLFAIVALFFPGLTSVDFITLFAVYATMIGVVSLIHGFRDLGKITHYWFSLSVGMVMVAAGVYLVRHPIMDQGAFLALAGGLILIRGIADLFVSAFFSYHDEHRILWVISGVVGIIAGIMLWRYPFAGVTDFVWVLGLYALIAGSVSMALASRIRG